MKYIKRFENKLSSQTEVLNKSFGYTMNDIDDLIDGLEYEYKHLPSVVLIEYLSEIKEIALSLITTSFSFDDDGVMVGIENFPNTITLYRIVDNDTVNETCLGSYWTYSKEWIKSDEFQNNVGFDKNIKWWIIEATFRKTDIEPYRTLEMLVRNTGEREIDLLSDCIKPLNYKIFLYDDFI